MSLINQLIVGTVLIAIVLDFMFGRLAAVIYTMIVSTLFVLVMFLADY